MELILILLKMCGCWCTSLVCMCLVTVASELVLCFLSSSDRKWIWKSTLLSLLSSFVSLLLCAVAVSS